MFAMIAAFTAAKWKWCVRAVQEARSNLEPYDQYCASFSKHKQHIRTPGLSLLSALHVREELERQKNWEPAKVQLRCRP